MWYLSVSSSIFQGVLKLSPDPCKQPKHLNKINLLNSIAKTLCVPSDSDPNFQKSYQNLTTFWGEILPNSDSKFWLGGNNKGGKLQLNFWNWQKQRYTLKGGLMSHY